MARRRLLWQIFPSSLALTLLALVAVVWLASGSIRQFYLDQTARDLEAQALVLREQLRDRMVTPDAAAIDSLAVALGEHAGSRLTVILPDGRVAGDTEEDPGRMESHGGRDRPEIRSAFTGATGRSIRYSQTLQRTMLYVAIPVYGPTGDPAPLLGVVRAARSMTAVSHALRGLYLHIGAGALAVALLSGLVGLLLSRRLSRPLEELRRGAEAFGRGDLRRSLPVSDLDEVGSLAETLNRMATELDERIRELTRERNEQEAILHSISEGVLAVDDAGRIVTLNEAAAQMLGIDRETAAGRAIEETVRVADLQRLIAGALQRPEPVEGAVLLRNGGERHLLVHGAPLRDAQGREMGAVFILGDVTHLRRLERVRQDFVANVSHELKTPITSIKAAVETLQEGALGDAENAERILHILARQSNRLHAIIEDLLRLARLEKESQAEEVPRGPASIAPVLEAAAQTCQARAEATAAGIEVACEDGLAARINPALLENAVVNLIDNALRHSGATEPIRVSAYREGSEAVIAVSDQGCGIAAEHLERIFERFYRVDRARSRSLGGTGLGLAIVKHIAQVHGGRVSVESRVGSGSTFRLHIPAA